MLTPPWFNHNKSIDKQRQFKIIRVHFSYTFKTFIKSTTQLETEKKVLIISLGLYFPEDDQFKNFKVAASLRQIDSLSLGAFPIAHFHNFVTRIYFWSVPIFFFAESARKIDLLQIWWTN